MPFKYMPPPPSLIKDLTEMKDNKNMRQRAKGFFNKSLRQRAKGFFSFVAQNEFVDFMVTE